MNWNPIEADKSSIDGIDRELQQIEKIRLYYSNFFSGGVSPHFVVIGKWEIVEIKRSMCSGKLWQVINISKLLI